MTTFSLWFACIFPVLFFMSVLWLVVHFSRRVTEDKEPSETDEWQ